jgi:hypothetical protein
MADSVHTIALSDLAGCTGRGVRIAILDTGVHPNHPHIGGAKTIEASIAFDAAGSPHADVIDRVGHGTAVTAAIHEKAPDAALMVVKIFDRGLVTTGIALAQAIQWAMEAGAHLINLSLGSTNEARRAELVPLIREAASRGSLIVAAAPTADQYWLPGALSGVIAVELDWNCPRDECVVTRRDDGAIRVRASGFPRPIPGVDPERNLKGLSFAVANATGLLALTRETGDGRRIAPWL